MVIWLTEEQTQTIVQHAIAESPNEACGIVGGMGNRAHEVIPAPNVATDPQHYYKIDDRMLTQALFSLQKAGLSIIGFYHSHPNGDFRPSVTDIQQAFYPGTAYIIVGLINGIPRLAAWQMNYGEAVPVEILVGSQLPVIDEEKSLSSEQKFAIIISAIIAFVFMIILSLSLLPPAPVIP